MGSTTNDAPPADRPPGGGLDRLILAPALGLAALIVVLCATVSLRVPLHRIVAPVECLLAVAFVAVVWRWHRSRAARPMLALGLLALLAGWLALVDYAGKWLPNGADVLGIHSDNWAFQAFADYFDRYRRGQADGMPMVDEFGAHFMDARFAASALLAFMHHLPLLADVQAARLTFALLCLGVHFFSVVAFGRVCVGYANWLTPLLAAGLATAGGWLSRALLSANDDNLLFVSLVPAFIALCAASPIERGPGAWRRAAAIGILFAAMIYNYPEGMALLAVLCVPLAVEIGWSGVAGGARSTRWLVIGAGGLLGVGLAMPYLSTFVSFLRHEIGFGLTVGSRPGEGSLNGLLGGYRLAGAFALGDELPGVPGRGIDNGLALLLVALVIVGAWRIARHLRWFPWVALPLLGLCVWQNVGKHYDYGTFKVLLLASWWTYPAISAGLLWITERCGARTLARVALAGTLLFSVCAMKYLHRRNLAPVEMAARFRALEQLATLHFVTGQSPVLLALDDDFDYLWATYYLRDLPLGTRRQRGYFAMPHITPYLARGIHPPPESCPYTLYVGERPGALWHNSRFTLARTLPVYLAETLNPSNGLEMVDGQRFLWIGTQPATFRIFAASAGRYTLSAERFSFGPSLGGKPGVQVAITDADGTRTLDLAAGVSSVLITLAAGDNDVVVRCLDRPEPGPHNGDGRELMLGVLRPNVAVASPGP